MIVKGKENLLKYFNLQELSILEVLNFLYEHYTDVEIVIREGVEESSPFLAFNDGRYSHFICLDYYRYSKNYDLQKLSLSDIDVELGKHDNLISIDFYVGKNPRFLIKSFKINSDIEERLIENDLWYGEKGELDLIEIKLSELKEIQKSMNKIISDSNYSKEE